MHHKLTSEAEGTLARSRKPYCFTGTAGGRNGETVAGVGGSTGGCVQADTGVAAAAVERPDVAAVLTLRALGAIVLMYAH
jgi:hypothetical protein